MIERNKKDVNFMFYAIIALIFVLISTFSCGYSSFTLADDEASVYSNVLEDLQTDINFKAEDFPINEEDFSLKVIQIAESTDKELFVYVYQPCSPNDDLHATTIRISQGINDNTSYRDYKLTLLNSNDTLYKYKVDGIEIKEDVVRYYDIPAIHRVWNEKYDEELPKFSDNTIDEVAFEVGQLWTVCELENDFYYSMVENETITITDKFVGFARLYGGTKPQIWGISEDCDSHFVAFSTDKPIEYLYEAEVEYTSQSYTFYDRFFPYKDEEIFGPVNTAGHVELNYKKELEFHGHGLFAPTYSWNEIQSVDDFISTVEQTDCFKGAVLNTTVATKFTPSAEENLKNKQWVLRFLNTDYTISNTGHQDNYSSTLVGDVTILRLKFMTNGIVYNLGVVDNKQTGSINPSTETTVKFSLSDSLFYILLAILALLILIPIFPTLVNFLVWLVKGIWTVIKYIAKGIWWVITLPLEIFKKEE